ncbi:LmeA family phospholipid-binding protein [Nostocoides sp. Soil756]|jgi:hypothetical protein|uniref:LmeA family phospholipid-binding protein n=1 Tax=Nostocoides sp. Soil756 TaxID=1736399 RepID=UPI0006FD6670|nr:LmeA family phospholipid-binding protein [Tetrasphaera sp. Soil756]KRE61097.1 hypothetical protein ASG78_12160 [Tetrasphaera sp. Soil756]
MKQFLLGVVSTLVVLVVGAAVLLASLGSGAAPAVPRPSATPTGTDAPPADLAADETWLGSVELSSSDLVSAEGGLSGVRARGTGVRFGPEGLHADTLRVSATVPFATVAEQIGPGASVYAAPGGRAGITRSADLLGRTVTIRATGTVRADGGQLLIEPETVDLGGPAFLDAVVGAAARALVTIRQPVPGVPAGLVLRTVTTTPSGFAVVLDGADVTVGR